MDKDIAIKLVRDLLSLMIKKRGSDLFITAGFPPAIKVDGQITPASKKELNRDDTKALVYSMMNDRNLKEYEEQKECNFAISPKGIGRFRVNAFVQQGNCGAVLRTIETRVPELDRLGLPEVLKDVILTKNGLVIMVGGTGSGKSTTLAAMLNYRNQNSYGHIITIEDPIEYVHPHKNCLITQREVGIDTDSWGIALKNALRQAPDVILIGEIRDRDTMEFGIAFAETGHLALATLHANSSNQALDRIVNFFPEAKRQQLLMDLSLNLKAVVSQRLLKTVDGKGRTAAVEIMLNTPLISDLILKGDVHEIKSIMAKSNELGMKTFDQALFDLYEADKVSYQDAMRNADSMNELRLKVKLQSKKSKDKDFSDSLDQFQIEEDEEVNVPGSFRR